MTTRNITHVIVILAIIPLIGINDYDHETEDAIVSQKASNSLDAPVCTFILEAKN
jgi:hypothetical protein